MTKRAVQTAEQIQSLHMAMKHVTDWSIAVDGGANAGDWTDVMKQHFAFVHAVEPGSDVVAAMRLRFAQDDNVLIHHRALWDKSALMKLVDAHRRLGRTRSRYLRRPDWRGSEDTYQELIEAITIDSLELNHCGLIKLDLEGAEMLALKGAVHTLERHKPVLIIECYKHGSRYSFNDEDPGIFLKRFGYREANRFGVDRIYVSDR